MRKLSGITLLILFPIFISAQYTGTGKVTQGLATTTTSNLYTCAGGRIAGLGTITASDNSTWTVPAEVSFTNSSFPFASVLNNACTGQNYATTTDALNALNSSNIVDVDAGGELITAYVFADNYFEMYINGTPVGKDDVPYTQFNSNIIQFRVNRPFTIAVLLVDWEENLGLGSEDNGGFTYYPGDGGLVAVFKDSNGDIIATTGSEWKAQTFYTAPITDLSCPTESGTQRLSGNCSTQATNSGSNYYGLHWSRPTDWEKESFNDSDWPSATTFTDNTVGVGNKPAYTNFTDIWDDASDDAEFIWSTNLILDNEVIVRYTVAASNGIEQGNLNGIEMQLSPNPSSGRVYLTFNQDPKSLDIRNISIFDITGQKVFHSDTYLHELNLKDVPSGLYMVRVQTKKGSIVKKLLIE